MRLGTYLVEKFVGKGSVNDGGRRLATVRELIDSRLSDDKKSVDISSIKDALSKIIEADSETDRREKVGSVSKQLDAIGEVSKPVAEANEASFSNVLLTRLSGTSFYKLALGVFLIILLIWPTWIKASVANSELGRVFRSGITTISDKLQTVKIGSFELNSKSASDVDIALRKLVDLKDKIPVDLKPQYDDTIENLKIADRTIKTDVLKATDKTGVTQNEGWIYLGKTTNSTTLLTEGITVNKTDIQHDLKRNQIVSLVDTVYLRKETNGCPRSAGEIITAIPTAESVTLESDAVLCSIKDSPNASGVWVKIKRNN